MIWYCQYHIVWVPKYRYRVLKDRIGFEVMKTIRVYTEREGCEVIELNVQEGHIHLLGQGPTKYFHIETDGCDKRKGWYSSNFPF